MAPAALQARAICRQRYGFDVDRGIEADPDAMIVGIPTEISMAYTFRAEGGMCKAATVRRDAVYASAVAQNVTGDVEGLLDTMAPADDCRRLVSGRRKP